MSQEKLELASLELIIAGNVQGVGYRYFAQREAQRIGVTGYVMNLPDGRVKVVAEGTQEVLSRFLEELRRGPSLAWVEEIQAKWGMYGSRYHSFSLRFLE